MRGSSSQVLDRKLATGFGVQNPTTVQDVDKLIRGLQAEQRAIKHQLGGDMSRIKNDPRMADLWAEERKLRHLREQVADLNVLEGGPRPK